MNFQKTLRLLNINQWKEEKDNHKELFSNKIDFKTQIMQLRKKLKYQIEIHLK